MASIRNSISLQDHMTPVFRTIMKSMDSTLRLMRQLDRASNSGMQSKAYQAAARDVQRANNELTRMQNNLRKADLEASKLKRTMDGIGGSGSKFSKFMSGLGGMKLPNLASALYLIKNIASGISNTMAVPDSLNQAQYRLEQFDKTGATGSQLYNSVYKTALDSRADVGATADLASRILVSGATKGSGAASIQMAGLLNKASVIGGSTQEEAKRALTQLSQGLSSGVLQGDELRAIREQAPGLTDVMAKGLSSLAEKGALPEKFLDTSIGDLKQLGADGELTADRIIAAFSEMEGYIDETFDKSPKTFGQAMTGITSVWKNFLKQMSTGDNAFARLTEKAWDLYEFFISADGENFFRGLGNGINFIVNGIIDLIDWFTSLDNCMLIVKSVMWGLAAAAAVVGTILFINFLMAYWPLLLIIATVALIAYALQSLGISVGEVVGFIVGIIFAAVAIIWNILVGLAVIIIDIVIMAGTLVGLVVQAIVQIVLWMIGIIITVLGALAQTWNTIWNGFQIVVKGVVWGVAKGFMWLADKVLGVIQKIAEGIDWVFGSNLASAVKGWRNGLDSKVDELDQTMGISIAADAKDIGDGWKDFGSDTADLFSNDLNLIDNMGGLIKGAGNLMGDFESTGADMMLGVGNSFNAGMDIGKGLDSALNSFSFGDKSGVDTNGALDKIARDGVGVDGGNLDSVGSIKSDVDISDEDIQLLRDIAARDFLLNVQTITPKANIKFGDIKETADVNKIVEVIEDMVEEQLATSLVTD